jgi:hypothetical protein
LEKKQKRHKHEGASVRQKLFRSYIRYRVLRDLPGDRVMFVI